MVCQIARVTNCTCYKLYVLQIARVTIISHQRFVQIARVTIMSHQRFVVESPV